VGGGILKIRGLGWGNSQVWTPQFGNAPHPWALSTVKHEAKFIINQTYVDHKAYEWEGYYAYSSIAREFIHLQVGIISLTILGGKLWGKTGRGSPGPHFNTIELHWIECHHHQKFSQKNKASCYVPESQETVQWPKSTKIAAHCQFVRLVHSRSWVLKNITKCWCQRRKSISFDKHMDMVLVGTLWHFAFCSAAQWNL